MASDPRPLSESELAVIAQEAQRNAEGEWECASCGSEIDMRDGDPTAICDNCAHEFVRRLGAEVRALREYALRCAQAIGVSNEADGVASAPGPIEDVERYIVEARRKADATDELRRDAEVVRGGHWEEVIAERDAAIRERDDARQERDGAKLRADAMTADANARTLERDAALRRAQEAEAEAHEAIRSVEERELELSQRCDAYRAALEKIARDAVDGGPRTLHLPDCTFAECGCVRCLARAALSAEVK